jgi:hypothetical protein
VRLTDGRLDKLYPALTAKERALLVLRAWKQDEDEDRRVRLTMPESQTREFNRCIDLMNGAHALMPYIHVIGLHIDQLSLRYGWLLALELWAIHALSLGEFICFETKEPITESEYRQRQETARAEMVPASEFAELMAEDHEGWAAGDLKGGGDGEEPTVTDAAWKRVCGEKERELASLVETGVLEGARKGKRLLINAASFYAWRSREVPVWPDWGLEFDVLPDTEAKEIDRRRRARESARQALQRSPTYSALVRRGPGRDSGDGGVEDGADRIRVALEERLRQGASTCWLGLVSAEKVVDEVAAEFGGEDPLQPTEREALRDARIRLEELIKELGERLGPLELAEPPDDLLATLRKNVGLSSG